MTANREGIFSLVGYFAMQILGIGLGRQLYEEMLDENHLKTLKAKKIIDLKDKQHKQEEITARERKLIIKVFVCEILLILAYF